MIIKEFSELYSHTCSKYLLTYPLSSQWLVVQLFTHPQLKTVVAMVAMDLGHHPSPDLGYQNKVLSQWTASSQDSSPASLDHMLLSLYHSPSFHHPHSCTVGAHHGGWQWPDVHIPFLIRSASRSAAVSNFILPFKIAALAQLPTHFSKVKPRSSSFWFRACTHVRLFRME